MRDINAIDPLPKFVASEPLMTEAELQKSDAWADAEFRKLQSLLDFECLDKTSPHMLLSRPEWMRKHKFTFTQYPARVMWHRPPLLDGRELIPFRRFK